MSIHALNTQPQAPSARELMRRALEPHILLGMPHLTPFGLSETWLMKELGHRHWLMLALELGMDNADFRTCTGDEAYSAITATRLTNARLDLVAANDIIEIRSTLQRVSGTQTLTHHGIWSLKGLVCEVSLLSVFVYRAIKGDNHSIARVPPVAKSANRPRRDCKLAERAAAARAGSYLDFETPVGVNKRRLADFHFRPAPSQEFNGASLLYFSQFQALVDRALEIDGFAADLAAKCEREIVFLGNLQMGENLIIETDVTKDPQIAFSKIRRSSGPLMALITTRFNSLILGQT